MSGPKIMFTLPIFGGIPVTETVTNSWIIMAILVIGSILLTRNLKKIPSGVQVLLEKGVGAIYGMVRETMGQDRLYFTPYIGTLFLFSLFSNLMGLFGFRAPTADLNTTACWALIFFCLVQYFGCKTKGIWGRVKGLAEPIVIITPLNIISEFSTPVAMAFRLFGNMAAGMVITTLLYGALAALSTWFFQLVHLDFLSGFPLFQLGLPALLSVYFDIFTGCIQAYIITMLNMVFIKIAMD